LVECWLAGENLPQNFIHHISCKNLPLTKCRTLQCLAILPKVRHLLHVLLPVRWVVTQYGYYTLNWMWLLAANAWCCISFLNVPFSMDSKSLYVPFSTRWPCSRTAIWSEITTQYPYSAVNFSSLCFWFYQSLMFLSTALWPPGYYSSHFAKMPY